MPSEDFKFELITPYPAAGLWVGESSGIVQDDTGTWLASFGMDGDGSSDGLYAVGWDLSDAGVLTKLTDGAETTAAPGFGTQDELDPIMLDGGLIAPGGRHLTGTDAASVTWGLYRSGSDIIVERLTHDALTAPSAAQALALHGHLAVKTGANSWRAVRMFRKTSTTTVLEVADYTWVPGTTLVVDLAWTQIWSGTHASQGGVGGTLLGAWKEPATDALVVAFKLSTGTEYVIAFDWTTRAQRNTPGTWAGSTLANRQLHRNLSPLGGGVLGAVTPDGVDVYRTFITCDGTGVTSIDFDAGTHDDIGDDLEAAWATFIADDIPDGTTVASPVSFMATRFDADEDEIVIYGTATGYDFGGDLDPRWKLVEFRVPRQSIVDYATGGLVLTSTRYWQLRDNPPPEPPDGDPIASWPDDWWTEMFTWADGVGGLWAGYYDGEGDGGGTEGWAMMLTDWALAAEPVVFGIDGALGASDVHYA